MTVVYTHEVATERGFGNFSRLLFRWKGSIYKLVFPELLVYMLMYFTISISYRVGIKDNPERLEQFRRICKYFEEHGVVIPLSFVLGFYVAQIVTRWWAIYMCIPWPDTLAAIISISVNGNDERGRLMRRTMMRYVNLCFVIVCTMVSPQVKARFPTLEHLVDAGILLPHEKIIIEHLNQKTDHPKYWIPIIWAGSIANRARKENRIRDDLALLNIVQNLCKFRSSCGDILSYDWICIPIVYTQVVTLAVYLYFAAALLGKQFTKDVDLYFPLFLFLEFFFYMGWLKVAETMVNPFGEDDDDFEVNWLIDRNIQVAYLVVDEMHEEHPEMVRDQYWDEIVPEEIPYTVAAEKFKTQPFVGSAAYTETPMDQVEFLNTGDERVSMLGAGSVGTKVSKIFNRSNAFGSQSLSAVEVPKNSDKERSHSMYQGALSGGVLAATEADGDISRLMEKDYILYSESNYAIRPQPRPSTGGKDEDKK